MEMFSRLQLVKKSRARSITTSFATPMAVPKWATFQFNSVASTYNTFCQILLVSCATLSAPHGSAHASFYLVDSISCIFLNQWIPSTIASYPILNFLRECSEGIPPPRSLKKEWIKYLHSLYSKFFMPAEFDQNSISIWLEFCVNYLKRTISLCVLFVK